MARNALFRIAAVDLAAVLTFGVLLALRLAETADPVSGLDGGNWLALANRLIGLPTKAASTVYPPLYLLLLLGAQLVMEPLVALRVTAALVSLLPGLGAYCLLRALGLGWRALIGFVVAGIGYTYEMLAWGGYPQLLGSGLLLGSLALLALGLRIDRRRYLALAGGLGGLALLANQLTGLQTIAVLGIAYLIYALATRRRAGSLLRDALSIATGGLIVTAPGIPIYLGMIANTTAAAFNAQGNSSLVVMLGYLMNEGPYRWAIPFAAVALALSSRAHGRDWPALASLLGLLAASFGGTIITGEVRFLYLGLIAAVVAFALALRDVRLSVNRPRFALSVGEAIIAGAVALSLVAGGYQRFDRTKVFYAVLDRHLVEGLGWLADNARPGDLAASSATAQNWALGWWVEGLGRVPTYAETDERWLAFRDEKLHSQIARQILSSPDPLQAAELAQSQRVTLLVLDNRGNARADEWLRTGRVTGPIALVYRNPSLTVFRVAGPDDP